MLFFLFCLLHLCFVVLCHGMQSHVCKLCCVVLGCSGSVFEEGEDE